jgi:hypothetical protein
MEELVKLDVTDPSIGGTLSDGDIRVGRLTHDRRASWPRTTADMGRPR